MKTDAMDAAAEAAGADASAAGNIVVGSQLQIVGQHGYGQIPLRRLPRNFPVRESFGEVGVMEFGLFDAIDAWPG